MDETQILEEIDNVLEASPVTTAKQSKRKISYDRVPMSDAIAATAPAPQQTEASPTIAQQQQVVSQPVTPTEMVNTTRDAPGTTPTIHINEGSKNEVGLVRSGGDTYIGGSVSPHSNVNATLRPMSQYARDPFWLESTERFTPVEPWTAKLAILNEPVKATTYDIDKFAKQIARSYLSVPEEDFFGYEYMPRKSFKESWYSSAVSDYTAAVANIWANTYTAIKGLYSEEEATKTPEQRAEENRNSEARLSNLGLGAMRKAGQRYLDYINQLEPIERGRGAQITGVAGSTLAYITPSIVSTGFSGALPWMIGAAGTTITSASETLGTRDAALANGATVGEAQRAQWKHLGFIGATELLTSVASNTIGNKVITASIRRGASKEAARALGFASGFATEGVGGNIVEQYQDRVGRIVSGQAKMDSLFAPWTQEEWTNFYGGLLALGLGSAAGTSVRAGRMYDETSRAFNEYMAVATKYKKAFLDLANQRGAKVSDATIQGIDNLIMRVWENPQAMLDEDMRTVAQGFFDSLSGLDPSVVEQAKNLLTNTPEAAQAYSQEAFVDYDNRIKAQPWFKELNSEEQTLVLGMLRGAAYVSALYFNTPPSELKIPTFTRSDFLSSSTLGHFIPSVAIDHEINAVDVALKDRKINIEGYLENPNEAQDIFDSLERKVILGEVNRENADAYADELLKNYKLVESKIIGEDGGQVDIAKSYPTLFKSAVKSIVDSLLYKSALVDAKKDGLGLVAEHFESGMPTDFGGSPFERFVRNEKYISGATQFGHLIETMLHEFAHANDWGWRGKEVQDFAKFAKWYVQAISAVFGKNNARAVRDAMTNELGYQPTDYTSHKNSTEWRAQAIGRLMRRAQDYIGISGMPAQYIQAMNILLASINNSMPVAKGVPEFVEALRETVNRNSKIVKTFKKSVPAERMRAAIAAYMGGEDQIDWFGITPSTLDEFAKSINTALLDSEALDYAIEALGDIKIEDFVTKTQQDWNAAWDVLEKKDPSLIRGAKEQEEAAAEEAAEENGLRETEKTEIDRETKIDGGLDPESEEEIEDWDSASYENKFRSDKDIADELARMAEEAKKKNPSEFQKATTRKFDGQTVRESMEDFNKTLDEHKNVAAGRWSAFRFRGPEAMLTILGGKKLANIFSFVTRYEDYTNRFLDFNERMVKRVSALFGGSRTRYENYIRETSVPMYKIDYKLPSGIVVQRKVSKRELMSALLYDEQPDSRDRIAKTIDVKEAKKLLDPIDVKFAHELRQILYDDYRKVKGKKGDGKVPENYWPIMDSYAQERGDTQIVNDYGRKKTDEPIGLVDVMSVIGGYMSRRAGAESGYFAAARRLNTVINYDKRKNMFARMDDDDIAENEALDKLSSEIQQKIKERIGTINYERLRDAVTDVIGHKNENDLKDSLASRISRNVMSGLLIGKLKQIPINMAGLFGWLGYEHNTYHSFVPNVIAAIIDSVGSWKLAMENESLRNRRALYRYNEVMHKNLSANSDNLLTYVSDWATKHKIYSIEAVSDLLIHLGQMFKKTMAFTVRESDAYMNAIGYAASYKAAVRALGSEEAAKISLAHYLSTTQSTSNQATKSTMVRKFNREGVLGSVFAFTSEPTQKSGSMTEAMNEFLAGEISFNQMSRVLLGNSLSMAAYVAVQAGWLTALLMPLFGGKLSDDDWDRVYDYALKESVAAAAGLSGPYSNIVVQPFLEQMFFDYNVLGTNNVPMLAEAARMTIDIKKGNEERAAEKLLSFMGILNGVQNLGSFARGVDRYINSGNRKETSAGLLQAFGFSEAKANNMSGIKKTRKKK